jgi:hypothetical protein
MTSPTRQARSTDDVQRLDDAIPPQSNTDHAAHHRPVEQVKSPPREIGGREGPDPTRYGDWEMRGRCIDF